MGEGELLDGWALEDLVAEHLQRLAARPRPARLLHLTGGDVEEGLDGQERPEQGLGAADAAALAEVVQGVECPDDVSTAGQVAYQCLDRVGIGPVGRRLR